MHECTRGVVGDGVRHFIGGQYGGKRHVAAGQRLAYAHDVRFYTRVLPGKQLSGASEARCYFIEDKQQTVFAA